MINNQLIFDYKREVSGGTEYMARNFHNKILPNLKNIKNYLCLLLPGPNPEED